MWFRCSGGNGTGGGATITVTYSSQFYNKTMTCTKGTKTYTKTTTSSGSTVFDVDESGTWTVTCDGVSRTVDVVLEYSTQMAITQTITVYGAASDTISFTDATGAKTVTTDSNGEGSVVITFIPPSASITFTSSIANNPNNLSQAYSKTVTISDSTSEVYVMPDGVLYWYGFESNNFTVTESHFYPNGYTQVAGVKNTQNVSITLTGARYASVGTPNQLSNVSKAYCIISNTATQDMGYLALFFGNSIGDAKRMNVAYPLTTAIQLVGGDVSPYTSGYLAYMTNQDTSTTTATIHAMWYE